jgi:anti-sigma B factor antagonist
MSTSSHQKLLSVEDIGQVTVVDFMEQRIVDDHVAQEIGCQLRRIVVELQRKNILLDFRNVEFLSGKMLGELLDVRRKCDASNATLTLCDMQYYVYEMLMILKQHKAFRIMQATREEARERLEGSKP